MKLKLDYVDGKTEWIDSIRQVVINAPHISNGFGFRIADGEWVWSHKIMYATLDGERIYPTENAEFSEPIAKEMKEELRLCEVNGKKAYFHRWVERSQIIKPSIMVGGHDGGVIKAPFAIVEFDDGTVEEHSPHKIIFMDWSDEDE